MNDWPSIQAWRKSMRQKIVEERLRLTPDKRRTIREAVEAHLQREFPELSDAAIAFYWPIKGEIDLRGLMGALSQGGADIALPVVATKNAPLEFWSWNPDCEMTRGAGNIPIPRVRVPVMPTVVLIPLLGFDSKGHRLGYGGGYYDRTLAAFRIRPLTIGVGYNFSQLPSIHPQAHDMPLDAIVTESGVVRLQHEQSSRTTVSSSPCYLDDFDDNSDSQH
tara:strand:+ start:863 stop:1522 length:660 start_codon:yes stop_codon:yes gene_type:complete